MLLFKSGSYLGAWERKVGVVWHEDADHGGRLVECGVLGLMCEEIDVGNMVWRLSPREKAEDEEEGGEVCTMKKLEKVGRIGGG